MKDDLILEVQKLDRRATPGPWVYSEGLLDISGYIPIELEPLSKENGEFIARSRTLLPILCDLLKQTWEWDMYQCAIRDRDKLKRKLVAAQNAQRWIPASEPPKEDGEYLGYCSFGNIWFKVRYKHGEWQVLSSEAYSALCYVTHWMPLPMTPKEAQP